MLLCPSSFSLTLILIPFSQSRSLSRFLISLPCFAYLYHPLFISLLFVSDFHSFRMWPWTCKGIPTLVILDEDRNVITTEARMSVMRDPEGAEFPWYRTRAHHHHAFWHNSSWIYRYPKPLNDVSNGENVDALNESPALIILMEKSSQSEKDNAIQVETKKSS